MDAGPSWWGSCVLCYWLCNRWPKAGDSTLLWFQWQWWCHLPVVVVRVTSSCGLQLNAWYTASVPEQCLWLMCTEGWPCIRGQSTIHVLSLLISGGRYCCCLCFTDKLRPRKDWESHQDHRGDKWIQDPNSEPCSKAVFPTTQNCL